MALFKLKWGYYNTTYTCWYHGFFFKKRPKNRNIWRKIKITTFTTWLACSFRLVLKKDIDRPQANYSHQNNRMTASPAIEPNCVHPVSTKCVHARQKMRHPSSLTWSSVMWGGSLIIGWGQGTNWTRCRFIRALQYRMETNEPGLTADT